MQLTWFNLFCLQPPSSWTSVKLHLGQKDRLLRGHTETFLPGGRGSQKVAWETLSLSA